MEEIYAMAEINAREEFRNRLKDKKRIVVKIGSSSLQHPETGDLDYTKLDVLVREPVSYTHLTLPTIGG